MSRAVVAAASADDVDTFDVTVDGPRGPIEGRLYQARDRRAQPAQTLLVFFHGGGFVAGSLEGVDPCMRDLAREIDAVLLSSSYAQASEEPFPAAAEDAYAVIAACAAHPKRFRWSGKVLAVGGIEAGGNLAAVAVLMARDRGGPALAGQLLVMPMLDPGLTSPSMRNSGADGGRVASACAGGYRDYLPRASDRMHPYACPLASSRLKGLPRTLIVSMEGDPLTDEATRYASRLVAAGVDVKTLHLPSAASASALADDQTRCRAALEPPSDLTIATFLASLEAPG